MVSIAHSGVENRPKDEGEPPRRARGAVYFAAPLTTYDTPRYGYALLWLGANLPQATIIGAREAFTDRADWLARWPAVVGGCAALTFITDEDGYIGRGVADEIALALLHGKPVHLLTGDGRRSNPRPLLVPYERLRLGTPDPRDWRRWQRVMPLEEGGRP